LSINDFIGNKNSPLISTFIEDEKSNYTNFKGPTARKNFPTVGNDVWIGQDVLLNDGIHISDGAIVASQSVVTKNIEPYSIYGGNPARLIRMRFNQETIDLLLQTKWWEYKFTDFSNLPIENPYNFAIEFLNKKQDLIPYDPPKVRFIDIP
jgi:hypothetical protein